MKNTKLCGLLAAIAVASALMMRAVYSQIRTQKPSATLTIRELFTREPNTAPYKVEYKIVALRADGSRAEWREVQSPAGAIAVQREISDLPSGTRILLDGLTNSRVVYRFPEDTVAVARMRRNCPGSADGERILGYEVSRQVEERQDEKHDQLVRSEAWLAPSLDCVALRERRTVQSKGQSTWTTNLREVVSVAIGEPDPKYFAVPADYMERKPSEVLAEYKRRYGESGAPPETAARLDAIHASAK
jgi:hypothetical protein